MTGSRVFGPALAGVLVMTVGFGWCFAVDGLSYIAVLVGLLMMRTSELHAAPPARGPRARCARASATPAACPSCGCRW